MSKANIARIQGDNYQARLFWLQACRLFTSNTKVVKVAFELDGPRSLDDVAVYYDTSADESDNSIRVEYYQVKFHTTAKGAITWEALMDPSFINAKRFSFLERLRQAQLDHAPDGFGCRFNLYTPWTVHPDDPLASAISSNDGRLIWGKLSLGGPNSKMGKVRQAWRTHLGIDSDDELRIFLTPVRFQQGLSLSTLSTQLNLALENSGLVSVSEGTMHYPYDDLAWKLVQAGRNEFSRDDIEQICRGEKLWKGYMPINQKVYTVGIRSFIRGADYLEDETECLLTLTDHFFGRNILDNSLWQTVIQPDVSKFLAGISQEQNPLRIHLETHSSIAFVAGYYMDTKSGVKAIPIQATLSGRVIWEPEMQPINTEHGPAWSWNSEIIHESGSDVALAISVVHDVVSDVREYVNSSLPAVGRIMVCAPPAGPGNMAIVNGTHGFILAQQLSRYLKTERTADERAGVLHIFAAAPNAFLFFLGQLARGFGPTQLYEYSFESNLPGAYTPSFTLPIAEG